jgi:hypothetical protein
MTDKLFIQTVNECKTMAYAARTVGMAYSTFIRKAKRLNCYNPNQGQKGLSRQRKGTPLNEIFEGKHPQFQSYKLKRKMIRKGIIEDKCSICGWNKKPEGSEFTPCELDHIDGNSSNHSRNNLRMLCPNCHSLTKTYRFRRGKKHL